MSENKTISSATFNDDVDTSMVQDELMICKAYWIKTHTFKSS